MLWGVRWKRIWEIEVRRELDRTYRIKNAPGGRRLKSRQQTIEQVN
jgi:hypothetical protein